MLHIHIYSDREIIIQKDKKKFERKERKESKNF